MKGKKPSSIRYYMLSAFWFALMAERTASNKRTAAGYRYKRSWVLSEYSKQRVVSVVSV